MLLLLRFLRFLLFFFKIQKVATFYVFAVFRTFSRTMVRLIARLCNRLYNRVARAFTLLRVGCCRLQELDSFNSCNRQQPTRNPVVQPCSRPFTLCNRLLQRVAATGCKVKNAQ